MKNKVGRLNGFTLIEVLISLMIMTFATVIISTLFSFTMKTSLSQKKLEGENIKSDSQMERGIAAAKEYSNIYEEFGTDAKKKISRRTEYVPPESIPVDRLGVSDIEIGGIKTSSIQGFSIYSNSKKYSVNKKLPKYNQYTFLSEGYSLPHTPGFDIDKNGELFIKDNRFSYIFASGDESTKVNGRYKVEDKDKAKEYLKLVGAVRTQWFITKPYDSEKNHFVMPYTDEEENPEFIRQSTRNASDSTGLLMERGDKLVSSLVDYEHNDKEPVSVENTLTYNLFNFSNSGFKQDFLGYFDNDIFFVAQTLNTNGYVGPLSQSTPGLLGTNKYSVKHYIGLPYINYLLNHMDANLTVRPDKNNKNKWYNLAYGSKDNMNLSGSELKIGTDSSGNESRKIKFCDVRDYTNTEASPAKNSKPCYTLSFAQKNGAFDFSKKYGVLNYNNNIYSTVDYLRSDEFSPYSDGVLKNPLSGTIILKFKLNNSSVDQSAANRYQPYRILSVNLNDNGDFISNNSKHNVGYQIYVDNNNKLWLNIIDIDVDKAEERKGPYLVESHDLVSEMTGSDFGLSAKEINPYYYDGSGVKPCYIDSNKDLDGRKNFMIMAIEYNAESVAISMTGYDYSNSDCKYINYSKVYKLPCNHIKDGDSIKIGGDSVSAFFGKKVPVSDLDDVDDEAIVQISDFLYYHNYLSTTKVSGNSTMDYAPDNALFCVMDYLYRKTLTENERSKFDSDFVDDFK